MDAFIGTILPWAGTFAPAGWFLCDGSTLQINQYQALFAVISFQYGGDNQTNFKIPDLRGRTLLGAGGPSPLTNRVPGAIGGDEKVTVNAAGTTSITVTTANLPAHSHPATLSLSGLSAKTSISVGTGTNGQLNAVQDATLTSTPTGASGAAIFLPATAAQTAPVTLGGVSTTVTGNGGVTVGNTGGGTAIPVSITVPVTTTTLPPFQVVNYIICWQGIFPQRP